MRYKEFAVKEEYLKIKEEDDSSSLMAATLVSILQFIRGRAEDQHAPAKISTDSLINLVKNVGYPSFCYDDLVDANDQIDTVKNIIRSFNEEEVILHAQGHDDEEEDQTADQQPSQDPESTVDSMAKSAMKQRQ